MNNYRKGARLERLARAELERQGYSVIRSAGSKGAVDLAAFNQARVILVQVKARRVTRADRCRLANFPAPPGALRQFWRRMNGSWAVTTCTPHPPGQHQKDQIVLLLTPHGD